MAPQNSVLVSQADPIPIGYQRCKGRGRSFGRQTQQPSWTDLPRNSLGGVFTFHLFGAFCVGEIVGRQNLIGYDVKDVFWDVHNDEHEKAHHYEHEKKKKAREQLLAAKVSVQGATAAPAVEPSHVPAVPAVEPSHVPAAPAVEPSHVPAAPAVEPFHARAPATVAPVAPATAAPVVAVSTNAPRLALSVRSTRQRDPS